MNRVAQLYWMKLVNLVLWKLVRDPPSPLPPSPPSSHTFSLSSSDLTGESSLMSGALDIMKLLMTSKDNPGPFTLTINER